MLLFAALLTYSCGTSSPPGVGPETGAVHTLSELSFSELEVPPSSRPDAAGPPASIPVTGPWRYVGTTRQGMHKYATAVPIRPRGLFFQRAQRGMVLRDQDGVEIAYDRFGKRNTRMWSHDRRELLIYQPERAPAPNDGEFFLTYPKADARERRLNQITSGREPGDFVWTTIQDDWDSRSGLLLPAPGRAAWSLTIPPSGELRFVGGLVEPEVRETAAGSDGARIVVEIDHEGQTTEVLGANVAVRKFTPRRVDLSRWAGKEVTLRVRTESAGTPTFDYVFLAEPVVASRLADPVRVVMVFIDTLRPDHMSLYGYERDTTAAIDGLGAEAAVFTNARSVAPWTLPSARAVVTGRHPEYYDRSPTVQSLLKEQGWASAFMAGNVYLSSNFGMARDWDLHRVGLWPMAEKVTDDTLAWLDEHEGRNAIVQVHYMDPHLPYIEPPSYRRRYAGDGPDTLREEFHRPDVVRARAADHPEMQSYIRDRYDNNIRYATDQVARIVDRLDDNDVLLLFADHGEEFWEHGNFEHGHSLFDELLRVPLVIRAPGITPRQIDAPVSVMDLTPTILDLVGVTRPANLDGRSLVPLLRSEPGAEAAFAGRDLAFGRPLYGMERWGVLLGDQKWTTNEGREALYNLSVDPGETSNLFKGAQAPTSSTYLAAIERGLGRPVVPGYRLTPSMLKARTPKLFPLWALCTVPGGFRVAWAGDDPLDTSEVTLRLIDDRETVQRLLTDYQISGHPIPEHAGQVVEACWHGGKRGSREVYLVPDKPLDEVGMAMQCSAFMGDATGGKRGTMQIAEARTPAPGAVRTPLNRIRWTGRQLLLQYGFGPQPNADTQPLEGHDDESTEMLEALGYVGDNAPGSGSMPCVPPARDVTLAPMKP